MSSIENLVEIEAMVGKLLNEITNYNRAVQQELIYINNSNDYQFDITHTIESVMPTEEESYEIIKKLHEMRNKRRESKDGEKIYEINKTSIFTLSRVLSSIKLQTSLEPRCYQVRTKEGEELIKSIKASSERSKVPFMLLNGERYASSSEEIGEYVSENTLQPTLDLTDSNDKPELRLIETPKEDLDKYTAIEEMANETLTAIKEDGLPANTKDSPIQRMIDLVDEMKESVYVLERAKSLWVLKKGKTILVRSSKLSKVIDYARKEKIRISVETKSVKTVSKFLQDNPPKPMIPLAMTK